MSAEIIVAIISAAATIIAVVVSNVSAGRAMDAKLDKKQAVTDTKIDMLTAEVKKHNDFAMRVPVLEDRIKAHEHRIENLERKGN